MIDKIVFTFEFKTLTKFVKTMKNNKLFYNENIFNFLIFITYFWKIIKSLVIQFYVSSVTINNNCGIYSKMCNNLIFNHIFMILVFLVQ